jgi:hypothetical protein
LDSWLVVPPYYLLAKSLQKCLSRSEITALSSAAGHTVFLDGEPY